MFKRTHKARYIRVVLKARTWKRAPMKLLKWKKKMTAKKQEYDLVTNDEYDTRIPLHPDEAFTYGITFEAKYIGTMDVPRPMSRVEIVAAMRRVRYEFKARGVKKRKVTVDVSIDGVRITTRSKSAGKRKTSTKFFGRKASSTAEGSELMHHPIYRIFYVSHDSSDLKIFSYIARDGATNVFKCNVFKSNRKSQAMRIVRTVGQAFEVCHKMQVNSPEQPAPSTSSAADEAAPSVSDNAASKEAASDCGGSEAAASTTQAIVEETASSRKEESLRPSHLDLLPPPPRKEGKRNVQRTIPTPSINLPELPECVTRADVPEGGEQAASTPLSAQHQLQLLRERLEQQAQQTRAAVAQLLLLRDQLAAEQAARCEAQARTHQLLVHNKELLEHIAALVAHLQDRERGTARPISAQQLTLLPQKAESGLNVNKTDHFAVGKGIRAAASSDALIDLFSHSTTQQNIENNNNPRLSPYSVSPAPELVNGVTSAPCFGGMSNDEIQNYLISKFQDMGGFTDETSPKKFNGNQQFYQNSKAFPNIPPLTNHYSAADLATLLGHSAYAEPRPGVAEPFAQAMSLAQSENSLFSPSRESSSKDSTQDECSSDEGGIIPFIMPLSHNGMLTATGSDGRVRLIVPVSPSESAVEVRAPPVPTQHPPTSSMLLPTPTLLAVPAAPITRTTSEKVPNRSEMMTALRSQWTRHTTK